MMITILYFVYILIAVYIGIIILIEVFNQKNWKNQLSLILILIPLILRIFQIK